MEIAFKNPTFFLLPGLLFLRASIVLFGLSHLQVLGTDLEKIIGDLLGGFAFRLNQYIFDVGPNCLCFALGLGLTSDVELVLYDSG